MVRCLPGEKELCVLTDHLFQDEKMRVRLRKRFLRVSWIRASQYGGMGTPVDGFGCV